ncbi:MAG TPA: hypothetical protein VF637_17655 [Sphingomicrobium sp.]|jgi:hypothetical protein
MTVSPPLRFLVVVLGGWVGVRSALLGSAWFEELPAAVAAAAAPAYARLEAPSLALVPVPAASFPLPEAGQQSVPILPAAAAVANAPAYAKLEAAVHAPVMLPLLILPVEVQPLPADPPLLPALTKGVNRWSASAWVFGRRGGWAGLVPGGMLGGSQAGGRLAYRLNGDAARPLAVSVRGYAPLDRVRGAEAAAGLDWTPVAKLPVHLLVERRQALGEEGRSAFAAMAYGGVSEIAAGPFSIDAYGQAGVVGARSKDLFADGSAKVSLPVAGLKVGAGVWAAVQPGVSRVDVGPQASVRLPGDVTLAVDWRLRVAGDAAPGSGPAITLSTDF